MSTESIFMLAGFAVGFASIITGAILMARDERQERRQCRRKSRMPYDYVSRYLKASNAHWLYCAPCERWWFTSRQTCARCTDTLEQPANEILAEFMTEFLDFWNAITEAGMKRPYPEQPQCIFSENEVAGLMWTKQRAEKTRT